MWFIMQASGRSRISQGCTNLLFCKLFARNCIKMKKTNLDRGVEGDPHGSALDLRNCKHSYELILVLCVIYVISLEVALHCELRPVNHKITYSVFVCDPWTWDLGHRKGARLVRVLALIFLMEQECTPNTAERNTCVAFGHFMCLFATSMSAIRLWQKVKYVAVFFFCNGSR